MNQVTHTYIMIGARKGSFAFFKNQKLSELLNKYFLDSNLELQHNLNLESMKLATKNLAYDHQRQGPIRMKIKESLVMKEVVDEFACEDSQTSFDTNSTIKPPKSQIGSSGKLLVFVKNLSYP